MAKYSSSRFYLHYYLLCSYLFKDSSKIWAYLRYIAGSFSYYHDKVNITIKWRLPRWLSGKEFACNAEDTGHNMSLILGREDPLEEGMTTHASILTLENPMDRRTWWATVYRITQSWTIQKQLSTHA